VKFAAQVTQQRGFLTEIQAFDKIKLRSIGGSRAWFLYPKNLYFVIQDKDFAGKRKVNFPD